METTQVIYTRSFSNFGRLQKAHVLQYTLTSDPQEALPYGVAITTMSQNDQSTQFCRALFRWKEDACRLLAFLWENSVDPQTMPGLVEDLRHADLLPCWKEEK